MNLNKKIYQAIKNQDLRAYQEVRYLLIDDGEEVIFDGLDFSDVDFSMINCGFFVFKNCNLSRTKGYSGQPIIMENCIAHEIDLRGVETVLIAKNSDYRGLKIDDRASLANIDSSVFENCQFDEVGAPQLNKLGAIIK